MGWGEEQGRLIWDSLIAKRETISQPQLLELSENQLLVLRVHGINWLLHQPGSMKELHNVLQILEFDMPSWNRCLIEIVYEFGEAWRKTKPYKLFSYEWLQWSRLLQ
uniref:Uncharacterized protein n=1 Tax=Solanum lycopersicum TaxID=4081 RepID=A0A3Q7JPJ7_SOLLC